MVRLRLLWGVVLHCTQEAGEDRTRQAQASGTSCRARSSAISVVATKVVLWREARLGRGVEEEEEGDEEAELATCSVVSSAASPRPILCKGSKAIPPALTRAEPRRPPAVRLCLREGFVQLEGELVYAWQRSVKSCAKGSCGPPMMTK